MFTIVQASTDLLAWKAMGHVIHTRGHEHENLPLEEGTCHGRVKGIFNLNFQLMNPAYVAAVAMR